MSHHVDLSTLPPSEADFYQKFGRLPKPKAGLIKQHKKSFDSADWAKNKQINREAGKPPGSPTLTPKMFVTTKS